MKRIAIIIDPNFDQINQLSTQRMNSFREWLEKINFVTFTVTKTYSRKIKKNENNIIYVIDPTQKIYLWINRIKNVTLKRILHITVNVLNSIFLIPDSNLFWYKKVLKNEYVKEVTKESDLIISSNPLESSHLLNYHLSTRFNSVSVIDIRDGWNDESLNFYRKFLPFRRYYEKKIENKIYEQAKIIFTNSDGWKKLLLKRNASIENKIVNLPNRLDKELLCIDFDKKNSNEYLKISYAGKFTGSSFRRRPKLILEPLLNLQNTNAIEIELWGDFRRKDLNEINFYKRNLKPKKISIVVKGNVEKKILYKSYLETNGFILLSSSHAAIPSKVYEYIYVSKPIFAFVLKGSAIHDLLKEMPKVVFYYLDAENNEEKIFNDFFNLCSTNHKQSNYPDFLTEARLKEQFKTNILNILPEPND